jgi:hypothetical protein
MSSDPVTPLMMTRPPTISYFLWKKHWLPIIIKAQEDERQGKPWSIPEIPQTPVKKKVKKDPPPIKRKSKSKARTQRIHPYASPPLRDISNDIEQVAITQRCLYAGCTDIASNPMLDRCVRHSIGMLPPLSNRSISISEEEENFMASAGFIKCINCQICWVSSETETKTCKICA